MKIQNLYKIILILLLSQTSVMASDVYLVDAGDFLEISVWKEEGLEKQILVRPDGFFTFPLAGEIEAQGKSIEAIKTELVDKLATFIPEPEVDITLLQIGIKKVHVIGKVNAPGPIQMDMNHDMYVLQALSEAGGTSTFAAVNKIKIVRTENGAQTSIPFRYSDIEKGENLEQNILLKAGDVIVVP